uniref:Snakin 1 n=1 Tax=Allium cepa TaxID=4679 RepID=A0A7D5NGH5_ALLCE|nr:snakin 1 [Allium cepa]
MARISLLSSAILILLALSMIIDFSQAGREGSLKPSQCAAACTYRCHLKGHKKRCLFYCNHCCNKCLCVPSGTVGQHKRECPCYKNWYERDGSPKCP